VLLADDGLRNCAIARELECDEDTVGTWRKWFSKGGPKALRDLPRSGRPRKFTPHQVARVVEKATERPRDNGLPFSHWDSRALANLAIEAGITDSIHPTTVWRWLHEADLQPHRVRYWLKSHGPDFEARMQDITSLYLRALDLAKLGIPTFSIDEKTSIQAKERMGPDLLMIPGTPQSIDDRYIRHGTLCLTAGFEVATGLVHGIFTPDRPATVFAGFVRDLCKTVPDAPEIHLVVDQLSTHWHHELCKVVAELSGMPYEPERHKVGEDRRRFLMDVDKRVVVHFTPKHGSWLNQIEIWFGLLCRKLLHRESFASLVDLTEKIKSFIAYYNRHLAHPYRWTYTGTPCRN
jgi:transposase